MAYVKREIADAWVQRMKDEYPIETAEAIANSKICDEENVEIISEARKERPQIVVEDMTTDKAIHAYDKDNKTAALNFASYTRPGGAMSQTDRDVHLAQEEALCLKSNLYLILSDSKFAHFYKHNKNHRHDNLYEDRSIYSTDVVFPTEPYGETMTDILTCAAPCVRDYPMNTEKEIKRYEMALYSRCRFILDTFAKHKVKTVILGAFGCGVFKNDPTKVATVFKDLLNTYEYGFETVVFAIPKGENFDAFKSVFGK